MNGTVQRLSDDFGIDRETAILHLEKNQYDLNLTYDELVTLNPGLFFANSQSVQNHWLPSDMNGMDKILTQNGHGFMAENANHLKDKWLGNDSQILGLDNAKHGADRMVNGVEIQSKYYGTASKSIGACFDKGKLLYTANGKPMQIEVPKDQYAEAIKCMERRISEGQLKDVGITNPNQAKELVREGHYTYKQVQNMAKFGTVESLVYDSKIGAVNAVGAMGISATMALAVSVWNGDDFEVALVNAHRVGLQTGGVAFATSVLAPQMARAGMNSAMVASSKEFTKMLGPKAYQTLARVGGSTATGGAAINVASKMLRGNVITGLATFTVLSVGDVSNIFRGRISGEQLVKNLANTGSTIVGGTTGFIVGQALIPIPVVGGLIGSFVGGAVAGKASKKVTDEFLVDDAEVMLEIVQEQFACLTEDYLLNQGEAEQVVDLLKAELTGKALKDMYASDNREEFARDLLVECIESVVCKRKLIAMPSDEQMLAGLRMALEFE